jgi:SAM-dependent methyltransferase
MSSFADALYGGWATIKTLAAGLPRGTLHLGVPDDSLQARLSLYQWVGRGVDGRTVLDLCPGTGYGATALLAAGAREILEGAGAGRLRADRLPAASCDIVLAIDDRGRASVPAVDAALARLPELARLLGAHGALLLASGRYADPDQGEPRKHAERLAQRLGEHYLRTRALLHLPPDGYEPRWRNRAPARARAQEYRLVPAGQARAGQSRASEAGTHETAANERPLGFAVCASIPRAALPDPLRLHLGSGQIHLDGWLNIDVLPLPGVDLVLDVTADLPFSNAEAVYSEHFLEHLEPEAAIALLARIHDVLRPGGIVRFSTPNLDYVWQTIYRRDDVAAEKIERGLNLNRAFYGWQHRFLWNRELLELVLRGLGFEDLEWPRYGESSVAHLHGLERHPPYPDEPTLPHVLIVEARKGAARPGAQEELRERFREAFTRHLQGWEMERPDAARFG